MIKVFLFATIILVQITLINAQVREIESRTFFNQGDFEFNMSTYIGVGFSTTAYTNRTSYTGDPNYYEYSGERIERPLSLMLTCSGGYCIADGLLIEPEINLNFITDAEISLTLLGNVSYNFHIPRNNIFPFLKFGYGFSNYCSDLYYSSRNDNSFNTNVINAGAGLKFLYTYCMALKLEINYKNFSNSSSYSYSDLYYQNSSSYKTSVEIVTLSLGLSILL